MTCDLVRTYLDAYLDRELDAAQSLSVEEHLSSCGACSRLHRQAAALRTAIVEHAPRYSAPPELRARVQKGLRKNTMDWRWAALAAALLLAATAVWQFGPYRAGTALTAELVSSHVRSLMGNHLIDEPSTDQHTVKPWFAGKLDFSPPVKNLDSQGFLLAGGRLDYIAGRPAAALIYRRGQHVINLYIWPAAKASAESATRNGFHILTWKSEGMQFAAISDLNESELSQFSQAWKFSPIPNPHP
jgi:anti-sigma factor RsiW